MSSMPDRPLKLYEVRVISESEEVDNAEALFYQGKNLNAVIAILVNADSTAHILVYNIKDGEWENFSKISADSSKREYHEESDTIIEYIQKIYGEDGYGVYGHDEVPE